MVTGIEDGRLSFDEFYRRYWGEVYRTLAVVIRNLDVAREATDEAMARAYQRWQRVGSYDNPAGWVYRTALNEARRRFRRGNREVVGLVADAAGSWLRPSDVDLDRAIRTLSMKHREVVVLRYLRDFTLAEVARMLGISEGTVKSRLHRAMEVLRTEVER